MTFDLYIDDVLYDPNSLGHTCTRANSATCSGTIYRASGTTARADVSVKYLDCPPQDTICQPTLVETTLDINQDAINTYTYNTGCPTESTPSRTINFKGNGIYGLSYSATDV